MDILLLLELDSEWVKKKKKTWLPNTANLFLLLHYFRVVRPIEQVHLRMCSCVLQACQLNTSYLFLNCTLWGKSFLGHIGLFCCNTSSGHLAAGERGSPLSSSNNQNQNQKKTSLLGCTNMNFFGECTLTNLFGEFGELFYTHTTRNKLIKKKI